MPAGRPSDAPGRAAPVPGVEGVRAVAALSGSPSPKVGSYFRNRALRILPAYWVILLAVGVLLPAALVRQSRDQLVLGRLVEHPWLAVRNATLTQGYSPRGLLSGIAPAWSLAVEVVFYLALPLLGCLR